MESARHVVRRAITLMLAAGCTSTIASAQSALGTAQDFAALGASTVTNTGATTISGDLGVYPGSAITGDGTITITGTIHRTDGVAQQAQIDARSAFNMFRALPVGEAVANPDLVGRILTPGVYFFSSEAALSGALTLDFQNDPNAQFVFQIGSTLITSSGSTVNVINGSNANGIFWLVGSSATLASGSVFQGSVIADQSISMLTSATLLCGRAIALAAGLTMQNNTITTECGGNGTVTGGTTYGGSTNFLVPVASVPEPSSLALIAIGILGMGAAARKRTRTA